MQRGRIVIDIPSPPAAKPTEHDLIPHMLPGQGRAARPAPATASA
jgi:hypothetical protein